MVVVMRWCGRREGDVVVVMVGVVVESGEDGDEHLEITSHVPWESNPTAPPMYPTAPLVYYSDLTCATDPTDKKNEMGLDVKLSPFEKL
ncbi:hypothetical protein Tco_0369714 [Tanacetum coccineum]